MVQQLARNFVSEPANYLSKVLNGMSIERALLGLSEIERRAFTLVRLRGMSLD
ncbi:hypothetical protein VQ042_13090 [Aurantimonas sp. A2-1-M11]|uniref:hypothetical protein n=1 Tax=Aurantimonas sp. A2-1-M11 TaxID=3113712 RepID=UPI002F926E0C